MLALPIILAFAVMPSISDAKPSPRSTVKRAAPKPAGAQSNAAANTAFNNYLSRIRAKIDRNWYVADGKNNVVLIVTVAADGSVTNLLITSTPTDTKAEQAANDAFNQSQPLEALPTGTQSVKLILTFESTADPHGDSSRNISAKIEAPAKEPPKSDNQPAPGSN